MRPTPLLLGGMLLLATFALAPASADTCAPAGGLGYEETCVSAHDVPGQCAPEIRVFQHDPDTGDERTLHATCVPYTT